MPYITLNQLKTEAIEALSKLDDVRLQTLIDNTSAEVDEFCNTKFVPTPATCKIDPSTQIVLPKQPLLSVENVTVLGRKLTEDVDYFVYADQGYFTLSIAETIPRKGVSVDYTYGHADTPATVRNVVIDLIKLTVESRQSDSTKESEDFEDYNYKSVDVPTKRKKILSQLDAYKQVPIITAQAQAGNKVRAMIL